MWQDVIVWVSGQTGISEIVLNWVGVTFVFPFLGWLTVKIDFADLEKAVYVAVYGFGQKLNDQILLIKGLGWVWENWIEPFVIKMTAGIFRVIAQIPLAFVAGLNSRGESLVDRD